MTMKSFIMNMVI